MKAPERCVLYLPQGLYSFCGRPRRRALRAQTTLAGDAAGILERDYGIDAGEVLSMNVDTVETVETEMTTTSVVDAADADQILKTWSARGWRFSRGALSGTFTDEKTDIDPSTNFAVEKYGSQSRVKMTVAGGTGDPVRTFKNEKGYITPNKATYKTTFGATGGSSTHGEAWYWFKLDEYDKNGFAVVFDNHYACGPFSNSDYMLYLVKMVENKFSVVNGTATTIAPFNNSPEYNVVVTENNNRANITVSCSNSAATLTTSDGSSRSSVTWSNVDVKVEGNTTQAFAMFCYAGSYFANCSTTAEGTFIQTIVKSFGDIVYEPTWTDGALHMLINIDSKADKTMLGSDGGTESKIENLAISICLSETVDVKYT